MCVRAADRKFAGEQQRRRQLCIIAQDSASFCYLEIYIVCFVRTKSVYTIIVHILVVNSIYTIVVVVVVVVVIVVEGGKNFIKKY